MNFNKRAIENSSLVSEAITSLPFKVQGLKFRVKDTKHLIKRQAHCRSLVKTTAPCLALWMKKHSGCCFHSTGVVFNSLHCRITVTHPP